MLLRYIVSNFKSIGQRMEFSMMLPEFSAATVPPRYTMTLHTKAGDWRVLRRGAFFGPNASGKSVFIRSVQYARTLVVKGKRSGSGTGIDSFRESGNNVDKPSAFQFVFYVNGNVYEYGFSLNHWQIIEEWLYILTPKDFQLLFSRTTDEKGKTKIKLASRMARAGTKVRSLIESLSFGMQEPQKNQLFLYKLHDNGVKKIEDVMSWFLGMHFVFPESSWQTLPMNMRDETFKKFMADCLQEMNTGVFDITVVDKEMNLREFAEKSNMPRDLLEKIEEAGNGIINFNGTYFVFMSKERRIIIVALKFEHHLQEHSVNFDLRDESDGTKRLLDLLPILFTLRNAGEHSLIYFIDEIDRSLHTKLSRYLLEHFLDDNKNKYNQLLFTAHDVSLIDLENFAQEEIWFIEKNSRGESTLKPLSDFTIKKEQNLLQAYLNGRFGAVPVIRGWRE